MIEKLGYENRIIDSSSIEVDRRARHAKTDRIDGRKLLRLLIRHEERGDVLRVVRVPTAAAEDERRPHRELERLAKERTQHVNRIKSLLALHGITTKVHLHFGQLVPALRQPDGKPLPKNLSEELVREAQRLELLRAQIKQLEEKRGEVIAKKASRIAAVAAQIAQLRAFGQVAATTYSAELFGWRKFANRREVGAAAGLDGAPWQSGDVSHDQGIRKAGNRRVRRIAIESAWCWLRYQPQSALSRWYMQRFGNGSGRMRRIGIVALARKLLIAVWRFVDQGIVPDGAILKTEGSLELAR
jgi:transposase